MSTGLQTKTRREGLVAAGKRTPSSAMHSFEILLVEDDELVRLVTGRALARMPMVSRVATASDGREAFECLRGGAVEPAHVVVLLDLDLPGMSGLAFLQALREDDGLKGTPVVVLTGSEDEQDCAEAYRLGAAGYLRKPSSPQELEDLVRALHAFWSRVEFP